MVHFSEEIALVVGSVVVAHVNKSGGDFLGMRKSFTVEKKMPQRTRNLRQN